MTRSCRFAGRHPPERMSTFETSSNARADYEEEREEEADDGARTRDPWLGKPRSRPRRGTTTGDETTRNHTSHAGLRDIRPRSHADPPWPRIRRRSGVVLASGPTGRSERPLARAAEGRARPIREGRAWRRAGSSRSRTAGARRSSVQARSLEPGSTHRRDRRGRNQRDHRLRARRASQHALQTQASGVSVQSGRGGGRYSCSSCCFS